MGSSPRTGFGLGSRHDGKRFPGCLDVKCKTIAFMAVVFLFSPATTTPMSDLFTKQKRRFPCLQMQHPPCGNIGSPSLPPARAARPWSSGSKRSFSFSRRSSSLGWMFSLCWHCFCWRVPSICTTSSCSSRPPRHLKTKQNYRRKRR